MRVEPNLGFCHSVEPPGTVRFVLASDPVAIREGLQSLIALDLLKPLTEESRYTAQIVLAEVLNNIVEHAYSKYPGKIDVWVTRREDFLFVRIADDGLPMPGGDLPGSRMIKADALPEGGFGWFLIRSLSNELTYHHDGKRNILSLCISVDYQC
jgi:serine/threonine-protein kinase RsbW